jgi:arylsulfate sulfotransferase
MIQVPRSATCVSSLFVIVFCGILFATGCASNAPTTVAISPQIAAIGAGQTMQFTPIVTNDSSGVTWSATAGSIDANGIYTAPSQSSTITVTATSVKNKSKTATAKVNVVAPGQVASTANVQVASFTIAPAAPGNVSVQFGTDTNYGLTTWTQPVPAGGGAVSLFVAGMKGNTLYHMRGVVQFADGTQYMDLDQTFTTAFPALQLPVVKATTTPGMTPQSGVELLDLVQGNVGAAPVSVTDLNGNSLWSYNPGFAGLLANPIKLLPNGHFLINFSGVPVDGTNSVLQEVDLSGKLIWQMTAAELNNALAAATCAGDGCNVTVIGTHHDFVMLPNGHLIVIASAQQVISGTTVTGDVLIDLDQNHKPVWLWNGFKHLDINRQPYMFPDWTHTNAILYSADDGNLIISIRHQNWIVKVNYANGAGAGDIVWHLGYQGDFMLVGGTDPTDWFYAQHSPSFTTANTTGQFGLAVFDNGNDRVFPPGVSGTFYSAVPVFSIDETAKTATLTFNMTAPTYSFFGGNNAVLRNGDVEFCESAEPTTTAGDIYEVTQGGSAQTVWHMNITGQYAYRGQRMPSMYPGVQW